MPELQLLKLFGFKGFYGNLIRCAAVQIFAGRLRVSIAGAAIVDAIEGSTYSLISIFMSGNDVKTVFKDTLMGGFIETIFGGFTGGVGFGLGQAANLREFGRIVLGEIIT